jgi:sugar/nucleoside kinase (ribokinase family)
VLIVLGFSVVQLIDFIAFGIVIDDIVTPGGLTYDGILGGGGPQTAWGMAAALGSGERVGVASSIGADFDDSWLTPLRRAGINLDGVRAVWEKTPRAWQYMAQDGTRTHSWRNPPQGRSILPEVYQDARAMHWGLHPENPDLSFARELIAQDKWLSLETFKPPDEPLTDTALHELVTACRIFSPNWGEATHITGTNDYHQLLARFKAADCNLLALRRGANGADVWDLPRGVGVRVPAVPTTVIDTVGAGNTFCGALLASLFDSTIGNDNLAGAQNNDNLAGTKTNDFVGAQHVAPYSDKRKGLDTDTLAIAASHAVAAASYMIEQVGIPSSLPPREDYHRRFAYALARAEELALESPPTA